uniref:Uncharacterized protein n=1 Tax=Utricularia reniformis TaxID=192314 RepID=A0A1Y0AYX9_9LAMI|nr:hypothetical protein AEK19_MT1325 [Utricularia reniformis]ART30372.1 hypothetical protein AEK19_MT1325 [Utricularia reniformis]
MPAKPYDNVEGEMNILSFLHVCYTSCSSVLHFSLVSIIPCLDLDTLLKTCIVLTLDSG